MARGLEVLRAAIEDGRRVWLRGGDNTGWIRWEPSTWRWLDSDANEAVINWRVFWSNDWEVEPAPSPTEGLTFAEAVAAMDRGAVVTRAEGDGWLWRKSPDESWFQCTEEAQPDRWDGGNLDYHDMHATDWRIVQTAAGKGAPTFREFMGWLRTWDGLDTAWKTLTLYAAMDAAQTRWPAMFRQEES